MKVEKKLYYQPIGKGFIVQTPIQGGPVGRSLAMAYKDQNNKKYVEINGNIEPLEEKHSFLAVD